MGGHGPGAKWGPAPQLTLWGNGQGRLVQSWPGTGTGPQDQLDPGGSSLCGNPRGPASPAMGRHGPRTKWGLALRLTPQGNGQGGKTAPLPWTDVLV